MKCQARISVYQKPSGQNANRSLISDLFLYYIVFMSSFRSQYDNVTSSINGPPNERITSITLDLLNISYLDRIRLPKKQ